MSGRSGAPPAPPTFEAAPASYGAAWQDRTLARVAAVLRDLAVKIEGPREAVRLVAPNGEVWRLRVTNTGLLTTVAE